MLHFQREKIKSRLADEMTLKLAAIRPDPTSGEADSKTAASVRNAFVKPSPTRCHSPRTFSCGAATF
jgi:hypothetical protein